MFLTGSFFTRSGRERLAADCAGSGVSPFGAVSLDSGLCLGWQRMTCFGRRDICPQKALKLAANLRPVIDLAQCNGCGTCATVCPVVAIRIAMLKD